MRPEDVLGAMEANLADHLAHLPSHLDGAAVYNATDLLLVDAGVPSDTFNAVCRARLAERGADGRIAWAVRHFRTQEVPFSWWAGPTSRPADLGERLGRHGLRLAEVEVAMALDLSQEPDRPPLPAGLEVRRAVTVAGLRDYAAVIAATWDPPDRWVTEVYARAATAALGPGSSARYYVGYLDGARVAASECYLACGVAGVYSVVTLARARRQGIGTALTAAALGAARTEGYRTAVLQASAAGQGIYARLGFVACGEVCEYKP